MTDQTPNQTPQQQQPDDLMTRLQALDNPRPASSQQGPDDLTTRLQALDAEEKQSAAPTVTGGPSAEERAFLKANPDHAWVPADPKFPNRPAGIYPTGKGNEWRNDPSYAQAPIDLHFAKHTLEGAAAGAAAVAPARGLAAIPDALPSVLIHTVEGVKALGTWAEANPYKAFMLYQVAKELLPGAKRAMGFIKAAPSGE